MQKLLLATIFILIAGCTTAPSTKLNEVAPKSNNPKESEEIFNVKDYDELSLPAFSTKEFNGRDLKLGKVLERTNLYTRYYITYKSGDLTISGIMNLPAGEGPFPVLVLNHGYIDPAIYTNGRGLKREQDYFAKEGYIVIHPDYRNHAESTKVEGYQQDLRLGYTEDVVNAVYAVRESDLEYFDKENIGMLGHSMGGGITQNILVTHPGLIKAAVLYGPVSSDTRDNFDKWGRTNPDRGDVILENHGDFDEEPEFWDNISPINFFENIKVPVLIQQGTADESTPMEWADKTHQAMLEAGVDVTYNTYEGEPHEFIKMWPQFMSSNLEFFDKILKKQDTEIIEPVDEFRSRINLKEFGTYVTPDSSPVEPERFTGYHTGVDIEYTDATQDTEVLAITNGKVLYKGRVNGYGGVIILEHELSGQTYSVLYGHLDPGSLTNKSTVEKGERLGVLGAGYTEETDNERKHLHFSIKPGTDTDLRGYVNTSSELKDWINPLELL